MRVSPGPLSSLWQQPSCVQLVRVRGSACFPSSFPIQEERLRLLAELSPPMGAQLGTSHPNQGGTRHLPNRAFIQDHHIKSQSNIGRAESFFPKRQVRTVRGTKQKNESKQSAYRRKFVSCRSFLATFAAITEETPDPPAGPPLCFVHAGRKSQSGSCLSIVWI